MSMVMVLLAAQKFSGRYRTMVLLNQWKSPTWPEVELILMAFSTASRFSTGSLKVICRGCATPTFMPSSG